MEAMIVKKKRKAKMKIKLAQQHTCKSTSFDLSPSQFSLALMKISVSQICESVGLRRIQISALENLSHISGKYLEAIARSAAAFAEASNRTECNVFDIINGLHDLLSAQGFPGSAILFQHQGHVEYSVIQQLKKFVECSTEIPFAKPIPCSNEEDASIWEEKGELLSRGCHIPNWLPPFPECYQKCREGNVERQRNGEELWENSVKKGTMEEELN